MLGIVSCECSVYGVPWDESMGFCGVLGMVFCECSLYGVPWDESMGVGYGVL